MNDFNRIKSNVQLMIDKGAPPEKIREYLADEGMTSAQFKAHLEGLADAGKLDTAIRYSAGSGVANLLDLPGRTATAAGNLVRMGAGIAGNKVGLLKSDQMPETIPPDQLDVFNPAFRKAGVINDDYAPTDAAGRIVDFTTQAITGGGINPTAVARNVTRGAVLPVVRDVSAAAASGAGAGIGSEMMGKVNTGNAALDTLIRTGGTFAGGITPGGIAALRGTAGDRAAAAIRGVTPEQLKQADTRAKLAATLDNPITGFEAIQSVTGINPKMQTIQRVAEQSDAAANTLTPIMQGRPKANSIMFNNAVDQLAAPETYPDTLAGSLKTAAEKSIAAARKAGNSAAEPHYTNSSNNPANRVPPGAWNTLVSDDGVLAALKAVRNDPYAGLQGATEGSLQWLDQAKKHLDSQIEVAKRGGDNFAASQMSAARDKIVAAADTAFPDYAKARSIVAKNMQENVIPMEQSQVGKLARSDDFESQARNFLPRKPKDVNEAVVERTVDTINEQDPTIIRRFLAQDLRGDFNEANQGTNPMGGAQFGKLVADNPQQQANLLAALRKSGAATEPFENALDIFHAQNYKPPVNSATVANANEQNLMSGRRIADVLMGRVRPMVDNWRNGWATNAMAEALAAGPDTVPRIEELARVNGVHDPMKQQLLINLLLGNQTANPAN
ncbi:hypothetical protein EGT07_18215 [Herbaspirillum sp. HC18]|nr:hypothetical protein EGT07_18215 [Herbaspirillum sp. HC18]